MPIVTKKHLNGDLCIIGGGPTGVNAALAAARNGIKVVLVQDRSVLGGNSSSEVKMHIVGADGHTSRLGARESGIIEELRLEDSYRNAYRCYSQWDLLLYEKIKENSNITLLIDAACDGCETEMTENGKRIKSVHVSRHVSEDEYTIEAKFFADCTGDGRLGADAGAEFRMGREAKSEFNESHAMDKADHQTLGDSILFTAKKHETPQPFIAPNWIRHFTKDELKLRSVGEFDYGFWWAEWGGQFNTIKDNDKIRHELFRIALGVWNYIKNSGHHPDSANWTLDWVGSILGKREARRFMGDYIMVQKDIEEGRVFEDQVAYGGWAIDLHPPSGIDAVKENPAHQFFPKHIYSIPLRSLHSKNIENLFIGGRLISVTHVALGSTRVMATCSVIGQGLGTAAAVCVKKSKDPKTDTIRKLCDNETVKEIQQTLLKDDAFLLGLRNSDPKDLCLNGQCRASSNVHDAPAANVINGITRALKPAFGPWSSSDKNYWESTTLPASLEVELKEHKKIKEIHFTFDSGFHRQLTLSASSVQTKTMIRGAQPEVVKDYDIYFDNKKVLSIHGNYLRKRIHHLNEPIECKTIKIEVHSTHGIKTARIFEVRAYE